MSRSASTCTYEVYVHRCRLSSSMSRCNCDPHCFMINQALTAIACNHEHAHIHRHADAAISTSRGKIVYKHYDVNTAPTQSVNMHMCPTPDIIHPSHPRCPRCVVSVVYLFFLIAAVGAAAASAAAVSRRCARALIHIWKMKNATNISIV